MTGTQIYCTVCLIMFAIALVVGWYKERHSYREFVFFEGFFKCMLVELVILLVVALFLGAIGVIR